MILEGMIGLEVQQVCFGGPTILRLWPEGDISMEGMVRLSIAGMNSPSQTTDWIVARLADLVGVEILTAAIDPSNDLRITLSNGAELSVESASAYEAFNINLASSPSKIVGGAGGRLELWD